jgi:hypothetical protein
MNLTAVWCKVDVTLVSLMLAEEAEKSDPSPAMMDFLEVSAQMLPANCRYLRQQ